MSQNKSLRKQNLALALLLFLILSLPAFSQSDWSSMKGTVRDSSGAVMQNANVAITNSKTKVVRNTTTNSAGIYSVQGLEPGEYLLVVKAPKFKTYQIPKIQLNTAETKLLDIKMEVNPGDIETTVTDTRGSKPLMLTTEVSTGTVLDAVTIKRLPSVSNDVMDLINVIGGVIANTGDPVRDQATQMFGGTQAPGVAVYRDGINVNEVRWDAGINTPIRINADLVSEIKVILSPADAEYGRGAGQVQIKTKEGTDTFHMTFNMNSENNSLNGKVNRTLTSFYRNYDSSQQNYTATFSGPVIKGKMFYLVNLDQQFAQNRQDQMPIVLTACARKGIYRYFHNLNTTNAYPGATAASVDSQGVPRSPNLTAWLVPGSTTIAAANPLKMVSAFGTLTHAAKDQLAMDPINCSEYDPWDPAKALPNYGVATFWETGGTNPGYRTLNTDPVTSAIYHFNQLMPLPNEYTYTNVYRSVGTPLGGTTPSTQSTQGDGLNTAIARWTQKNDGSGSVYSSGLPANRLQMTTNINYNISDSNRLGINYATEMTSGVEATRNWPNVGFDGKGKRTPQQIGANMQSWLPNNMFNELRFGLARTAAHSFSPLKNPDNGAAVANMLKSILRTDLWDTTNPYYNQPVLLGFGAERSDNADRTWAYGAATSANIPSIIFSPGGSGTTNPNNIAPASHPYGSYNNNVLPTYGGADNRWTITDNFSWMHNDHSFKVGGDIRLTRSWQDTDGPIPSNQAQLQTSSKTSGMSYPIAYGGFTDRAVPGASGSYQYMKDAANTANANYQGLSGALQVELNPGGGTTNASTNMIWTLLDLQTYMAASLGHIRQAFFINCSEPACLNRWNDPQKGEMSQYTDLRQKEFSFFAKDEWRALPNLSVNLGVRYEYYGLPWAANGMTVGLEGGPASIFGMSGRGFGTWMPANPVDLGDAYTTRQTFIGPNSIHPNQRLFSPDFNNFGPAIGLAYEAPSFLGGKTIIRAGFQLSYRTVGNMGSGFGTAMANVSGTIYQNYYRGDANIPYMAASYVPPASNPEYSKFDLQNLLPSPVPAGVMPMNTMLARNHGVDFTVYDYNTRNPYTSNINVSLSHSFGSTVTMDVRYVGTLARKGIGQIDINSPNIFNNTELMGALATARMGGEAPLLDKMFKGVQFSQTQILADPTQPIGTGTAPTASQFVRNNWPNELTNGNFQAIARGIADLNLDKTITGCTNTAYPCATGIINYNTGVPYTPDPYERGSVLRAQNLGIVPGNASSKGMFPENYILTNPQLASANWRGNLIHSNYHSLQTQFMIKPARGMQIQSTYTFSKNLADNPGGATFWGGGGWTDPRNRSYDYRLANTRQHQWNTYGYWDLPIGQTGYFLRGLKNEMLSRLVDGWHLSIFMSMQSGKPYQVDGAMPHLYDVGQYGVNYMDVNPALTEAEKTMYLPDKIQGSFNQGHQTSYTGYNYSQYYFQFGEPNSWQQKYVIAPDPQCTNSAVVATSLANYCTMKALYLSVPNQYQTLAPTQGKLILQQAAPGTIGNYRKYVNFAGTVTLNLMIAKELRFIEGKNLVFRIDCTNCTNHPQILDHDPMYDLVGQRSEQVFRVYNPNAPTYNAATFSYIYDPNSWSGASTSYFGRGVRQEGNRVFKASLNLSY